MRRTKWAGLLALVFVFAGCNKEELEMLKAENTKLSAENTKLKADVAKSQAELKVFKDAENKKRKAKEDARKAALEYLQQFANILMLQIDGEEALAKLCQFFTCDSMATKACAPTCSRVSPPPTCSAYLLPARAPTCSAYLLPAYLLQSQPAG